MVRTCISFPDRSNGAETAETKSRKNGKQLALYFARKSASLLQKYTLTMVLSWVSECECHIVIQGRDVSCLKQAKYNFAQANVLPIFF